MNVKIHKKRYGTGNLSICGLSEKNLILNWEEVTCKNCLCQKDRFRNDGSNKSKGEKDYEKYSKLYSEDKKYDLKEIEIDLS